MYALLKKDFTGVLITYRHSRCEEFDVYTTTLRRGMIIGSRVNEDGEVVFKDEPYRHALPYVDFAYVVDRITPECIYLTDFNNNNEWSIKVDEINQCELVMQFHEKWNSDVDADRVNNAMIGSPYENARSEV